MKDKIKYHSIRLFDKNGFHGTSMRDIGNAAGCKMPTLYYYYESKEILFDEVVRLAYIEMVDNLHKKFSSKLKPADFCIQSLLQKKSLTEDEKIIHRLAMKTWLGFEGCDDVRCKLLEWESLRNSRNMALLSQEVSSEIWVRIITRTYTDLLQRIVLFDENIPNSEITEEMTLLFECAAKQKIKQEE
jgi:AcrR family transcriptional regulator